MKKIIHILIKSMLYFTCIFSVAVANEPDLTLIGQVKFAGSLTRLLIGLVENLSSDLKINCVVLGDPDFTNVNDSVKDIIISKDKRPGKISLLLEMPWTIWNEPSLEVPESYIKIAYSMLEGTEIPKQWVDIFNKKFDAIVVPDPYFVTVYKESGVIKPIFCIPCGMYLEKFLTQPIKTTQHTPFTFGTSAAFWARKNHDLLIEAFSREFGNDSNFQLKIHGRLGEQFSNIQEKIKSLGLENVILINNSLSEDDYIDYLSTIDCYVLLSKGEGFSLTPREALALGIPCILSENTSHLTFKEVENVMLVKSFLKEAAYYYGLGGYHGYNFNCDTTDAQQALRTMFANYERYIQAAPIGRAWVERYLYKNLKQQYLTLIKPDRVILGQSDEILKGILVTTSPVLYEKYSRLLAEETKIS